MGRLYLFEFEDQKWFPDFLRNFMTDFLRFLSNKSKLYKPTVPIIKKGLKRIDVNTIIDLSSGGGGLLQLNNELLKDIPDLKIILTDFPNISAFKYTKSKAENFDYIAEPVDARNVPEYLQGLRTQFLSLHHFKLEDARLILQNAVYSKQAIAIFEGQERSFISLLAMLLSPISVLITTPFIRPFKLGRLVFTYLIPIVPLCVLWDGIVSSLRTYSTTEMNELLNSLNEKDNYNWDIGRLKSGPGVILYLLGTKKD